MFDFLDLFQISTWQREARMSLFLLKWLVKLLSASVRAYLHGNFGRRYFWTLVGALLFFVLCAGLAPGPALMSKLFMVGLFVRVVYHAVHTFHRKHFATPPPHSQSTGDPWEIWQHLGFSGASTLCCIEPALCFFAGFPIAIIDPFLAGWLQASAVALVVEGQLARMKVFRRILDSLDAKHEAQALNAGLKQYQQPPGQATHRPNRAHFPRNGRHPNP